VAEVFITTPGGSSSNSLCTVAEADDYLDASFYDTTAWFDLTEAEKGSLLVIAGLVMNGMNWIGWPVYENQAMCWPRWIKAQKYPNKAHFLSDYSLFGEDESDLFTDETVKFPDAMKKAQAFIAYDVVYRGLQNRTSAAAGPASDAIRSLSLFGDISLSFDPGQEVPLRDLCNLSGFLRSRSLEVYTLLSPYVSEYCFTGDWDDWEPEFLDEVAATT
jgi:hypothetical protein